ncbi:MAG: hypothetical protein ACLQU2_01925 [Candidatus Binataceae bacterium]
MESKISKVPSRRLRRCSSADTSRFLTGMHLIKISKIVVTGDGATGSVPLEFSGAIRGTFQVGDATRNYQEQIFRRRAAWPLRHCWPGLAHAPGARSDLIHG